MLAVLLSQTNLTSIVDCYFNHGSNCREEFRQPRIYKLNYKICRLSVSEVYVLPITFHQPRFVALRDVKAIECRDTGICGLERDFVSVLIVRVVIRYWSRKSVVNKLRR